MTTQPEIFTVIFNSVGSNVLSIGITDPEIFDPNGNHNNYNTVTYNVNWLSFLPTKYKKFQCQFVFKSKYFGNMYTAIRMPFFKDNGIIDMNIGRSNNFNGQQMSNVIGAIQGVTAIDGHGNGGATLETYGSLYYSSTSTGNNSFSIDYPSNNQITISLNRFNNTLLPYMSEYCLFLTLTGILDGDIDKSN